jgi:hypothetical protein
MLTLLGSSYAHRHNRDGSHDSICVGCFATVATAQDEWELAAHESAHVCNAWDRERFSHSVNHGQNLRIGNNLAQDGNLACQGGAQ